MDYQKIVKQLRSPSGAANFCSGQSVSGPKNWFDIKGISLENRTK